MTVALTYRDYEFLRWVGAPCELHYQPLKTLGGRPNVPDARHGPRRLARGPSGADGRNNRPRLASEERC
jgi:hypothetical protein